MARQTKAANVRTIQAAVRSGTIERPTRGRGSKGDFRSYLRGLKPATLERKARAAEKLQAQGARNVPYAATRGHARITPEGIVRSREHNPARVRAVFHEKSGKQIRPPQWKVEPPTREAVLRTLDKIKGPLVRIAVQGTILVVSLDMIETLQGYGRGKPKPGAEEPEVNTEPDFIAGAALPLDAVKEVARQTYDDDRNWDAATFANIVCPVEGADWLSVDHIAFGEGKL